MLCAHDLLFHFFEERIILVLTWCLGICTLQLVFDVGDYLQKATFFDVSSSWICHHANMTHFTQLFSFFHQLQSDLFLANHEELISILWISISLYPPSLQICIWLSQGYYWYFIPLIIIISYLDILVVSEDWRVL